MRSIFFFILVRMTVKEPCAMHTVLLPKILNIGEKFALQISLLYLE